MSSMPKTQNGVASEPEAPPLVERRGMPAAPPKRIAHIVSVSGSQAIAVLERDPATSKDETRVEIGQLKHELLQLTTTTAVDTLRPTTLESRLLCFEEDQNRRNQDNAAASATFPPTPGAFRRV